MKEKMLKAINKGLLNVLSTDIIDNDIDFNRDDINNEYMPEISLDELNAIFNKDKSSIFTKRADTRNAVSLILDDDIEISLCEYEDNMRPLFIKIANDRLKDENNEILIYIPNGHYLTEDDMDWSFDTEQMQDSKYLVNADIYGDNYRKVAAEYYDGYETCQRIMSNKGNNKIYAVEYCMDKNINGHKGYLPSIGQLKVMIDCNGIMNYIFRKLHMDFMDMNYLNLWSSTEKSEWESWFLHYGKTDIQYKSGKADVVPVFTYKK